MIKTKRGLDLPIAGSPAQMIENARPSRSVGILGEDFPGLKPTMEVREGDRVSKGQVIFTDKKTPGVKYTSPASGIVNAVNRGAKRAFQSVVIDVEGDEEISFDVPELSNITREQVIRTLVDSGEWTALRNRPFNKVPSPESHPADIFVTAIDTRPLAADPKQFLDENHEAFLAGLDVLCALTEGRVFVCCAVGRTLQTPEFWLKNSRDHTRQDWSVHISISCRR
jgi:Na+-transporting NADH:ubiquinone oxidoreductase subunit A